MVIRIDKDIVSFDPYYGTQMTLNSANMERLHADDWTVDPAVLTILSPGAHPIMLKGNWQKPGNYRPQYLCAAHTAWCGVAEYRAGKRTGFHS